LIKFKNELIVLGPGGLFKIANRENYFAHLNKNKHALINSAFPFGDSIFLGTMDGVQLFCNDSVYPFWSDTNSRSIIINDLVVSKGKLLLGTQGSGIVIVDIKSKEYAFFENCGSSIRQVEIEGDHIWLVSDAGFFQVIIDENGLKTQDELLKIDLESSEFYHFALLEDEILLGTNKGIISLPKHEQLKVDVPIKIGVTDLSINDQTQLLGNTFFLDYKKSKVKIDLYKLDYKGKKTNGFLYQVGETDTSWIPVPKNSIFFPSLNAGEHIMRFKINGGNSNEVVLKFVVSGPFWKSWWFVVSMLITMGFIGFLVNGRVQKTKNNKLKVRNKILEFEKETIELKNEALRSQINPHFLFNCFSSLSELHKNKSENVDEYLKKLSSLLRHILNSSTERVLLAEEELDLLQCYLYLQKIRMKESFDYEIDIDEELIEEELKIPSMVLQPYIENAIEHGIRNIKNGKIKISIRLENDLITAIVEDNGKGLKSDGNKTRNHRSKSMNITQERIRLMNEEGSNLYGIEIFDLQITENRPGTKVCVTLPYYS